MALAHSFNSLMIQFTGLFSRRFVIQGEPTLVVIAQVVGVTIAVPAREPMGQVFMIGTHSHF